MAGEWNLANTQTKYFVDAPRQAELLCQSSPDITDVDVARFFNVSTSTIQKWKERHPEFDKAIGDARKRAIERVEKALFQRAIGYRHKAVKIMQFQGQPIEVEYTEHYPPDVNAITLYLTNKDPENWKDKKSQEITGPGGAPLPIINITLKAPNDPTP